MSSIKWKEAPNLICEISLNPGTMGQTIFTIIDESGNEYKVGPDYSFDVTVCSGASISRLSNRIVRVGNTSVHWHNDEVTRTGNIDLSWLSGRIRRIGNNIINWRGNEISLIGQTSISWLSGEVRRVGRASIDSRGSVNGTVK